MALPVKWVVVIVGLCLLLSVLGVIVLALNSTSIPDVLQNIAVGSLTGLVGLLVKTGETSNE